MTEIAYIIDECESKKQNTLIIRFVEVISGGPFLQPIPHTRPLTPHLLQKLCSSQSDHEVVQFLLKEEFDRQRRLSGRTPASDSLLQQVSISSSQTKKAFELLTSTKKLYFNAKQIVPDFYGMVKFYFKIEPLSPQGAQLSGHFSWRDQEFDIQDCDLVGTGRPHWFIKGLSLKFISTDVEGKILKQLSQKPIILEKEELSAFLDEIDTEDSDAPQIVFTGSKSLQDFQKADPLPCLILKDRLGAFADLWMDYGKDAHIALNDSISEIKGPSGFKIKRNQQAEKQWEKDLLETDFTPKCLDNSHYYCPVDKVAKSLTFLLEIGWHIQDWKGNRIVRQLDSSLIFDEDSKKDIRVRGKVRFENFEADVGQVVGAFNRRERFIQLDANSVGLLPDRFGEGLQDLVEEGEIVGNEIKVKRHLLASLSPLLKCAAVAPSLQDLKKKLDDFQGIEETLPDSAFQGTLRAYQQQGLNWLSFLFDYGFNGILADDMGLGKTVQVLALLSRLPAEKPHLIVVPTSLLFNWKNEIDRFLPNQKIYIHQGNRRAKTAEELACHPIILTSYTLLRLDIALFQAVSYQSLILDEAQMIKNSQSQIFQSVCSLESRFKLCMTGTPIENHHQELWSHFHFLMPDLLGEEKQFIADLQASQSDRRYLDKLKRKIAPFILRRKKKDLLHDLPERVDQTVWVTMTDEQRNLYETYLQGIKRHLFKKIETDGIQKSRMEILEALLRLRQICCHPHLVQQEEENRISSSAKWEILEQEIETVIEEGAKVLIYSQFTSMLKIMMQKAREKNWNFVNLDGHTQDREKVVNAFQHDPTIRLFFVSLKAGGVGLNLTAADYVFLYDPWWNDAVEEQAINRVHRMGRKDPVVAKRYVMLESIEEKMMKLKEKKRGIIDDLFNGEEIPSQFTLEDLKELF